MDVFLDHLFELCNRVPGDIQQVCWSLWETTEPGAQIGEDTLSQALRLIFSTELRSYEATLEAVSKAQKKCLVGLAVLGGQSPQSAAFTQRVGLQPATVRRSLGRLEDTRVIYRRGREYLFVNPFFRAWLLARGGGCSTG